MFGFNKKKRETGEIDISDVVVLEGDHEKRKLEEPIGLNNLNIFFAIIVVLLIVIVARTGYLQIVKGAYYADRAENNRISTRILKAPRGIIFDKDKDLLVKNIASVDAVIIESMLPFKEDERREELKKCFSIIEFENPEKTVTFPTIEELEEFSSKPFLIKENISQDEVVSIELKKEECPAFLTEKTAVREYEYPIEFSHVLGYVGKVQREDLEKDKDYLMTDSVGRSGIESYWENELRGLHGAKNVEIDSSGKILKNIKENPPIEGNSLILGIDKNMQVALYEDMKKIVEKRGVKNASAVAIDPRDGTIRALVSFPGYDNNLFQRKIDQEKFNELIKDDANPLLNRAIGGTYHPGSTVKPMVGVAALQEGIVSPTTSFDCHGFLEIDNQYGVWRFNDWKTHGSDIDIYKAIAYSCDVYYYHVGGGFENFQGLGVYKIKEYGEKFGLGSKTGIDLDGEVSGFIPTPEWKEEAKGERWYIGNTYHISIGQGDISTTPLQVANHIVPIANGGTLYQPRIVTKIFNEATGQEQSLDSKIINQGFIDRGYLDVVKQGMRDAVEYGTLKKLKDLENGICGKTGTAQIGGTEKTHSWFVGFAPKNDPEIVLAVLVEKGGESTDAAVPIARWFFADYFDVEIDKDEELDEIKGPEETIETPQDGSDIRRRGNRVLDEDDENYNNETNESPQTDNNEIPQNDQENSSR